MKYLLLLGANGSGKSSLIKNIQKLEEYKGYKYICADEVEKYLYSDNRIEKIKQARENALLIREQYLHERKDIIYESVGSHPSHLEDLERIKKLGYNITTIYVATENPKINLERIANRKRDNDTYLTSERVIGRYERSLGLLAEYIKRSDVLFAFDNSINYYAVFYKTDEGKHYLIGEREWANKYIVEKLQKEGIEILRQKDISQEEYLNLLSQANRLIVNKKEEYELG